MRQHWHSATCHSRLFNIEKWEQYTPYEGLDLANQRTRKLGVFGRKLKGSNSPFYCYFDQNVRTLNINLLMFKWCPLILFRGII